MFRWLMLSLGCLCGVAARAAAPPRRRPSWLEMEASTSQTWDSNLYWSDIGPYAKRASWMLHAGWTATATVPLGEGSKWVSSLAVEPCWVLEEPRENHVRSTVKMKGKGGGEDWTWDLEGTGRWVEGDDESLVWTAPGGAPALGGSKIRDRRDQMTWTHQAALLRRVGPWRFRVLARGFLHDFQTRQLALPNYQNYVDRSEWLGGFDIGHALPPDSGLDLGLGLRAGVQDQAPLLDSPIAYDNTFFRPVLWASGSFAPGWTIEGEIGPDFRHFDDAAGPASPGTRTDWVYQVQLGWNAGAQDRVRVQARQVPIPSSSGRGMFLDGIWRAEWRHEWNSAWSSTLSFEAHENDFYPANRRDRLYTPVLEASWSPVQGCELRAGYEYSVAQSDIPHTPAREFERHRLSTRIRFKF